MLITDKTTSPLRLARDARGLAVHGGAVELPVFRPADPGRVFRALPGTLGAGKGRLGLVGVVAQVVIPFVHDVAAARDEAHRSRTVAQTSWAPRIRSHAFAIVHLD